MRRDEHFIAGAQTRRDHRRRQGVAAAGREHEVIAAQMLRITRLEPIALAANAVTKQGIGLDYFGDCVDFILADDIHDVHPSFVN